MQVERGLGCSRSGSWVAEPSGGASQSLEQPALCALHSLTLPLGSGYTDAASKRTAHFPRRPLAWHFLAPLSAWQALLHPRAPASAPASLVDPSPPKEGHLRGSALLEARELHNSGPSGASICAWGRDLRPHSRGSVEKTQLSNHTFGACAPLCCHVHCAAGSLIIHIRVPARL